MYFDPAETTAARAWIGTPFRHQSRIRGERGGVDCWNLVRAVGEEVRGLRITSQEFAPFAGYARVPQDGLLTRALDRFLVRQSRAGEDWRPGDVILIAGKPGRDPKHCGILGSHRYVDGKMRHLTIVHSSLIYGGCVEHRLSRAYANGIVGVFRFR